MPVATLFRLSVGTRLTLMAVTAGLIYSVSQMSTIAAPVAKRCCGAKKTDCEGCQKTDGGIYYLVPAGDATYYVCGDTPDATYTCEDVNAKCIDGVTYFIWDKDCQNPSTNTVKITKSKDQCKVPPNSACPPPVPLPKGP